MIVPRESQTHAAVADHYDDLDAIYRGLWGLHVHHGYWRTGRETPDEAVVALSDLVGEALGFKPGARLIDIGCGYGGTARHFAGQGAEVTGLSLSREQIAHAPPAAGVELRCEDWLANSLPSTSFDGAYAIESSEHMSDKASFFREARRVLRPDGRLVICAWLAHDTPTRWQLRHLLEPICREGRLPSMLTAGEYGDLASAAGFRCLAYRDISRSVARTWSICLARFLRALLADPTMRRRIIGARNRVFALSVPRLMLAYRTGAMRYGVFTLAADN
jgi:tocopherol O-methyltransferase